MLSNVNTRRLYALLIGVSVVVFGCAGGQKPEAEFPDSRGQTKKRATDYKVFAALTQATTAAELPVLMGKKGEDFTPCLKTSSELSPEDAGPTVAMAIEDNAVAVNQAIRSWFVDALAPIGLTEELAARWQVRVEEPKIATVDFGQIRFDDKQQCVSTDTGFFPKNVKVATTLIGAQKFHFKTDLPIPFDVQEEMKKAVASEKMMMESPAFFAYEPAIDKTGKAVTNHNGEALFMAPGGRFVVEKEVPPPESRTMKEWTITAPRPLYFAYRELPDEAYRREGEQNVCDVHLVWNDLTPRKPECDQFMESSFVVTKAKTGDVDVTITTDGKNVGATIPFGKTEMLQVSDRILLWLSPTPIEEGVLLRLNSFVLGPRGLALAGDDSMDTGVPLMQKETKSEEVPIRVNTLENNKKNGKGIKAKTDLESIDEYLRN